MMWFQVAPDIACFIYNAGIRCAIIYRRRMLWLVYWEWPTNLFLSLLCAPPAARRAVGWFWPREPCLESEELERCSTRTLFPLPPPTTLLTREDPCAILGPRRSFCRLDFLVLITTCHSVLSFFKDARAICMIAQMFQRSNRHVRRKDTK